LLKKLQNSKNLVKLFGMMQLLEKYAATSLVAQSSKFFPSQVYKKVDNTLRDLGALESQWVWEEEDMKMSCCEAPAKMISRLVDEQIYRPKVFRRNVRSYRDLEDAGLIDEEDTIDDLFEDDEPIKPLAGEILMKSITWEDVREVEVELQEIAGSLKDMWEEKQTRTNLDKYGFFLFLSI
jgi:hypothetical protein